MSNLKTKIPVAQKNKNKQDKHAKADSGPKKGQTRKAAELSEETVGSRTSAEQNQNQIQEIESKYHRALADYQNLLRQTQKERSEYLKYANAALITQLLPLLDNLQMAHKHLNDPGLEMIVKQFKQILADENIIEIDPSIEEKFDEHQHEAIDTVETEDQDQVGLIAETSLAGYRYKEGQILRHAKVKVYNKQDKEEDEK